MQAQRNVKTRVARLQEMERGEARLEGSSQGRKSVGRHAICVGRMVGAERPLRRIDQTRVGSRDSWVLLSTSRLKREDLTQGVAPSNRTRTELI